MSGPVFGPKGMPPDTTGYNWDEEVKRVTVPTTYADGWLEQPDDTFAKTLYLAAMDGDESAPTFGELQEWQRDEYRTQASAARAFIAGEGGDVATLRTHLAAERERRENAEADLDVSQRARAGLIADVERLVEALRYVEWHPDRGDDPCAQHYRECPVCKSIKNFGHTDGCLIGSALAAHKACS